MDQRISDSPSYTQGGTSRRGVVSRLVTLVAGTPWAAGLLAFRQNNSVLASGLALPNDRPATGKARFGRGGAMWSGYRLSLIHI